MSVARYVVMATLLASASQAQEPLIVDANILAAGLERVIQEQTLSADTILVAPYFWSAQGPAYRVQLPDVAIQRVRGLSRIEWNPAKYDECRLKAVTGCAKANGRVVTALLTIPAVKGNVATMHVTLEIAATEKDERGRAAKKAAVFLVTLEQSAGSWLAKSVRQVGGS